MILGQAYNLIIRSLTSLEIDRGLKYVLFRSRCVLLGSEIMRWGVWLGFLYDENPMSISLIVHVANIELTHSVRINHLVCVVYTTLRAQI